MPPCPNSCSGWGGQDAPWARLSCGAAELWEPQTWNPRLQIKTSRQHGSAVCARIHQLTPACPSHFLAELLSPSQVSTHCTSSHSRIAWICADMVATFESRHKYRALYARLGQERDQEPLPLQIASIFNITVLNVGFEKVTNLVLVSLIRVTRWERVAEPLRRTRENSIAREQPIG